MVLTFCNWTHKPCCNWTKFKEKLNLHSCQRVRIGMSQLIFIIINIIHPKYEEWFTFQQNLHCQGNKRRRFTWTAPTDDFPSPGFFTQAPPCPLPAYLPSSFSSFAPKLLPSSGKNNEETTVIWWHRRSDTCWFSECNIWNLKQSLVLLPFILIRFFKSVMLTVNVNTLKDIKEVLNDD